jgi:hypothetical protein
LRAVEFYDPKGLKGIFAALDSSMTKNREDVKVSSKAQYFYNSVKDDLIQIINEKETKVIHNVNYNFNIMGNKIRNIT